MAELRNIDLVRLVSQGQSPTEFLRKNPPIFELPNRMRRAYQEYDDDSWEHAQHENDTMEQRVFHLQNQSSTFPNLPMMSKGHTAITRRSSTPPMTSSMDGPGTRNVRACL